MLMPVSNPSLFSDMGWVTGDVLIIWSTHKKENPVTPTIKVTRHAPEAKKDQGEQ